mgnify:CR=1 FL=1
MEVLQRHLKIVVEDLLDQVILVQVLKVVVMVVQVQMLLMMQVSKVAVVVVQVIILVETMVVEEVHQKMTPIHQVEQVEKVL